MLFSFRQASWSHEQFVKLLGRTAREGQRSEKLVETLIARELGREPVHRVVKTVAHATRATWEYSGWLTDEEWMLFRMKYL